jgi:hypothetical protein
MEWDRGLRYLGLPFPLCWQIEFLIKVLALPQMVPIYVADGKKYI